LDLGQALRTAYERARYDLRVDYRTPPVPPLAPAETAWAAAPQVVYLSPAAKYSSLTHRPP
jgi:hypothetical protein